MQTSSSNLAPSSLTQAVTYKLLNSWGYEGLQAHAATAAEFYRKRRDVFERGMEMHMKGLAEWNTPKAGMFFW
jgi:tryptophan aminotransferase